MSKIHGSFEYKKDNIVVHEDVCPPDCNHTTSDAWKQQAHAALDTWLDNSEGTGFFIIKELGYPNTVQRRTDLTRTDIAILAGIQAKVNNAIQARLDLIDPGYLNSKEATHIVSIGQDIRLGIEQTLNLFSQLEAIPLGTYDNNRRAPEKKADELYTSRKKQFDTYLKD